jgi:hypothetical protein
MRLTQLAQVMPSIGRVIVAGAVGAEFVILPGSISAG